MQLTRRGWELPAVAAVFIVLAVLAQQPLAMYTGTGVAAYGLARQFVAVRQFHTSDDALSITYTAAKSTTAIDEPVQLSLSVALAEPQPTTIEVTAALPIAADTETDTTDTAARSVRIPPGETTATTTFSCSFPVAGQFTFPVPEVCMTDATGRFQETLQRGEQPTVLIKPRTPRRIHVGQGGESVAAYGEHQSGQRGAGITPAELRRYVPGDARRRIDWKATARLAEPHVREFEAETDRETVLVVDARTAMQVGPVDSCMLDYVREVALGLVALAEQNGDPLGCYVVGDDGLSMAATPSTAPHAYQRVRTVLHDQTATASDRSMTGQRAATYTRLRSPDPSQGRQFTSTRANTVARVLAGDGSTFARTLAPFFDTTPTTPAGRDGMRPLVGAIERLHADRTGSRWTILLTGDTNRNEVRKAVQRARNDGDQVFVFLTPEVLFATDGLADVERAYERYADFERFRRELDRLGGVTAFEVGPGDRLQTVLDARRERISG